MGKLNSRVAGVTFEGRQALMKHVKVGDIIRLEAEPNNPYDPNAVAVIVESGDGGQIGYIPRDDAPEFKKLLADGKILHSVIETVGRSGPRKPIGCVISVVTSD